MAAFTPIYLFRGTRFARNGDTVVAAAPLDAVIAVHGSGGLFGEGGVRAAFGGCAFYRDAEGCPSYVGVWGARKASRFRAALRRAGISIEIVRSPPPARLMFWGAKRGRRLRSS